MNVKWLERLTLDEVGDRLCCAALVCAVFAGVVLLARMLGLIWRPM